MEEAKKGEAGQPSSSAPRFGESATLIFLFFCSLNSSPRNPDQSLATYQSRLGDPKQKREIGDHEVDSPIGRSN